MQILRAKRRREMVGMKEERNDDKVSRRKFMSMCGKTAISVAAFLIAGSILVTHKNKKTKRSQVDPGLSIPVKSFKRLYLYEKNKLAG